MLPSRSEILKVVVFKTSRSGGKGGQNVNKVSTKVELIFNYDLATFFTEDEKTLSKSKLENRLDGEGLLHVVVQEERSQLLNKEKAIAKLLILLKTSLEIQKKRKPTKIPKAVVEKRLSNKASKSEKKQNRKKVDI
ncbi:alternative ribosome rescue aminoacyl-tRNA hydrolase ArfB [Pedobacter sp. AW1-32]|uniref:alternative ribosome rescue aminoacyl-tRNA hydrolase ArfB n=1 Tax=Pedobacter sp. AW1-32 TaxID=3383026 RepID=UPI003FEF7248